MPPPPPPSSPSAPPPAPAARAGELLCRAVRTARPVGGGSICDAYQVELADGSTVFAKSLDSAPADFFAAESAGLARLRATGAVAVPEVYACERDVLVLEWVPPGVPGPAQAERLGRDLAALHETPAPSWGTPGEPCYLGPLPLTSPREPVTEPSAWPAFHAEHRLLPLLRAAVDSARIAPADARAVEQLCEQLGGPEISGPPQPPAVIHGDLWSGNVHWAAADGGGAGSGAGPSPAEPPGGRARLIDPAAQGGHPETDLALLALFGCPELPRLLAAYEEVRPVPGRAARVPLHQLQHLLAHAVLFGGGYGAQSGAAARSALGLR
ncbi:fructosamine kinase family protein [Streptomyces axinellae]|uniref:Fructosamine kinase family protein n=1 Tax=Streptomyces axinellae TaxID=552788 RepID=A0ABN3Q1I0_9ACTN